MFVKICGITRPVDAIAAADAGADAIGLNFVSTSRRRVDLDRARMILAVVPEQVMTVGVFSGHLAREIVDIATDLGLDAAQLHGDDPPELTAAVAARVPFVIRAVAADSAAVDSVDDHAVDVVMLDGAVPGSGLPFDWDAVGDLATRHEVLLAGGFHPGNVAEAIRRVHPWGVDVATGVEAESPAKDADAIVRFVAAARAAAETL
ncbi:phosphoribosylanthranilate isomerase [Actinospongicola halichondriae]|uniref:phosphoribosylanthranilate isomerase n=1 Tax=Actinospongicola halichondriae TaxID=3236844 RepID=UPI003D394A9A